MLFNCRRASGRGSAWLQWTRKSHSRRSTFAFYSASCIRVKVSKTALPPVEGKWPLFVVALY